MLQRQLLPVVLHQCYCIEAHFQLSRLLHVLRVFKAIQHMQIPPQNSKLLRASNVVSPSQVQHVVRRLYAPEWAEQAEWAGVRNRIKNPKSLLWLCRVLYGSCLHDSVWVWLYILRPKYAKRPTPMRPPMTVAYVPIWSGLFPLICRQRTNVDHHKSWANAIGCHTSNSCCSTSGTSLP